MTKLTISGNNVYGKMPDNQTRSLELLQREVQKVPRLQNVAKIIKLARVALGLTQSEFAKIVSIEPFSVSRWEKGISRPQLTVDQFQDLQKALKRINVNIFDIGGITIVSSPPELKTMLVNNCFN